MHKYIHHNENRVHLINQNRETQTRVGALLRWSGVGQFFHKMYVILCASTISRTPNFRQDNRLRKVRLIHGYIPLYS